MGHPKKLEVDTVASDEASPYKHEEESERDDLDYQCEQSPGFQFPRCAQALGNCEDHNARYVIDDGRPQDYPGLLAVQGTQIPEDSGGNTYAGGDHCCPDEDSLQGRVSQQRHQEKAQDEGEGHPEQGNGTGSASYLEDVAGPGLKAGKEEQKNDPKLSQDHVNGVQGGPGRLGVTERMYQTLTR